MEELKELSSVAWVEKFRPDDIDAMLLPDVVRIVFLRAIKQKVLKSSVILQGQVGSGKTTLGLILCKEIASEYLELNSSDDRGVDIVRGTIKEFVYGKTSENGIRIVFLDEADGMLPIAQRALKRLMEKSSKNARFILTTNHPDKILPAIKSRCDCFDFTPPVKEFVIEYLIAILKNQKQTYKKEAVVKLVADSYPDIRQAVRSLQLNCHMGKFQYEVLQKSGGSIDVKGLLSLMEKSTIRKVRSFIVNSEFDSITVYTTLVNGLLVSEEWKSVLDYCMVCVAEYAYRDAFIIDKELNLTGCCADLMGYRKRNR